LQMKVVTIALLSEKHKIGGSLARSVLQEMVASGKLKCVAPSSKMGIYTRSTD